jgi:hypothetical protein
VGTPPPNYPWTSAWWFDDISEADTGDETTLSVNTSVTIDDSAATELPIG